MKKLLALLCAILLLCAACAPVPPETPEQSAATTITTATTATTTTAAATETTAAPITAAATTTVSTAATTTATNTPTVPSTTAKTTTRQGYISFYPIPFTVDEYRAFLAEVAKNPEHITDTIAKDRFYKPEYFREWFVDKQAHVPLLSGEWFVTDRNGQEDHEVVIEQRGSCRMRVTNGDYRVDLEHYMYDDEESSVDRWLSTCFTNGIYEITKRRTLTTKDGREVVYIEARKDKDHSDIQALFINVDGYCWQITEDHVQDMDFANMALVEDLLRNLSFEKIEL